MILMGFGNCEEMMPKCCRSRRPMMISCKAGDMMAFVIAV